MLDAKPRAIGRAGFVQRLAKTVEANSNPLPVMPLAARNFLLQLGPGPRGTGSATALRPVGHSRRRGRPSLTATAVPQWP